MKIMVRTHEKHVVLVEQITLSDNKLYGIVTLGEKYKYHLLHEFKTQEEADFNLNTVWSTLAQQAVEGINPFYDFYVSEIKLDEIFTVKP